MGNQGGSGDGVRQLVDWYRAGLIGDVTEVFCFTNRPVWPQGIQWSDKKAPVPTELDWNLWLGTAPYKDYVDNLVPFQLARLVGFTAPGRSATWAVIS